MPHRKRQGLSRRRRRHYSASGSAFFVVTAGRVRLMKSHISDATPEAKRQGLSRRRTFQMPHRKRQGLSRRRRRHYSASGSAFFVVTAGRVRLRNSLDSSRIDRGTSSHFVDFGMCLRCRTSVAMFFLYRSHFAASQ